jgi:4-hydroxy-2-oxoheptanedioate aldolase
VRLAKTYADYINYDLEHAPFDVRRLGDFMRGLADGGPTRSGHRMPTVIATLPVAGVDEQVMRANAWMVSQVLDAGVHGILLCHARTPEAARAFVESVRYPMNRLGVGASLGEGQRGAGGEGNAARIWGMPVAEYLAKADVWPLNPDGEVILGLKIEDRVALSNAERTLQVPGIAFAEWGPSDMRLSLGFVSEPVQGPNAPQPMRDARARVFAAVKANKKFFLNAMGPEDVVEQLKEGVMLGPANEKAAELGRQFTKRPLPW